MTAVTWRLRSLAVVTLLLALPGCRSAMDLLYEPKAEDPLDGTQGSLAKAGVNTEMDWGPKQEQLLTAYKDLKEKEAALRKDLEQERTAKDQLQARLKNQGEALTREQSLRKQAEAETDGLRQKRRELEARILSLSIEKAKLERINLIARIAELQKSLEPAPPDAVEAAAPAPGKK
ncbi:MAG TPA: hypothetical protein VK348_08040 [Planctomycetota bacterium]|nr:hypothetical protein [Planctomycetota bacterium]